MVENITIQVLFVHSHLTRSKVKKGSLTRTKDLQEDNGRSTFIGRQSDNHRKS
ncbi:hypothetical protein AXX17_AT2G03160 [Arabidopsis thaliana]|uniref:Uncharacterized protein n=1 Tax=Arabidopsis thaliana TaxID=3702 RepID=A0A178VWL9_ARATH|nr:hypothetical protein AXX17_AT2G03160 [Arabidopsis thaliana]